mmetsp:Transcript_8901/g.13220  ORF Transcript_8901/g.13220 Transcript_8901/m.13220 type:complete len:80 (-) Transcript_8901:1623-1862(-)
MRCVHELKRKNDCSEKSTEASTLSEIRVLYIFNDLVINVVQEGFVGYPKAYETDRQTMHKQTVAHNAELAPPQSMFGRI